MAFQSSEDIIMRFKSEGVPYVVTQISKLGNVTSQLTYKFDEANNLVDTFDKKVIDTRKHFAWWALSVMFFAMQVNRTIGKVMTSSINTMMKMTSGATLAGQAVTRLGVHWEFLKFSIGEAIGEALIPLLPALLGFIDMIADFIQQHPEVAIGLIAGYFISMAAMNFAQIVLLLSSLSTTTVAASLSSFIHSLSTAKISAALEGALGAGGWLVSLAKTGLIVAVSVALAIGAMEIAVAIGKALGKAIGEALNEAQKEEMKKGPFGTFLKGMATFGAAAETGLELVTGRLTPEKLEERRKALEITPFNPFEEMGKRAGEAFDFSDVLPTLTTNLNTFLDGFKEKIEGLNTSLKINYTSILGGSPGVIPALKDLQITIDTMAKPSIRGLTTEFDTVATATKRAREELERYRAELERMAAYSTRISGGNIKNYTATTSKYVL